MAGIENIGNIENTAFDKTSVTVKEKMNLFNKSFDTKQTPVDGVYGVTEKIKDNGIIERTTKTGDGHYVRDYLSDNHLFKRRETLGGGKVATSLYDDKGNAYMRTVVKLTDGKSTVLSSELTPNITIQKGNFSSEIDAYGRPSVNKITDLKLRDAGEAKKSLSSIDKDSSYLVNDHKGHMIADSFGGPASKENIVAQLDKVNQGKMAQVENVVRDLKTEGHTVDYEVKANYADTSSKRPTSFEPKITVDGKEYTELPDDLKKIYNEADENLTTAKKMKINAAEKYGSAHELGKKSALVAAGITMTVSTVDNVSSYVAGEITAEEMITDIVEETATAGAVAYGTEFISTTVSQAMSKSSSTLISKVGGSCAPAAVVSFAVESYDDISAYAQGEIDGVELAYELGENAAGVAGATLVGAKVGAMAGSVAGVPGAVVGGIVGGVVGCVVATEAYHTAVEVGAECAEVLAETAQDLADNVVATVQEYVPEALDTVKGAFNDFASNTKALFA